MNKIPFSLLFVSLFLIACSAHQGEGPDTRSNKRNFFDGFYRQDAYAKIWEAHTKTSLIQGDFENYFEAAVTFWNGTMRKAFVEEMARVYRMTEREAQVLESEEMKENDRYLTFIISARSREVRWRDLDREDYLWRLSLENQNASIRVRPDQIEPVSDRDDKWRFFYKSMNRFSKVYRVRFPRKAFDGENLLVLHISGPLGSLSASFEKDIPSAAQVTLP